MMKDEEEFCSKEQKLQIKKKDQRRQLPKQHLKYLGTWQCFLCKDWLDVDSEGVVAGRSSSTELSWR